MSIVSSTGSLASLYTYSATWRRYDVSSSSDGADAAPLADIGAELAQSSDAGDTTAIQTTTQLLAAPEDSELDIDGLLQLLGSDEDDDEDEEDTRIALAPPPPPPPPVGSGQAIDDADSIDTSTTAVDASFTALDADGDGSVSLAEWQAGTRGTSNDADSALQLAALARYASGQYQGVADLAAPGSGLLSVAV